jgi:hypothetical protein
MNFGRTFYKPRRSSRVCATESYKLARKGLGWQEGQLARGRVQVFIMFARRRYGDNYLRFVYIRVSARRVHGAPTHVYVSPSFPTYKKHSFITSIEY